MIRKSCIPAQDLNRKMLFGGAVFIQDHQRSTFSYLPTLINQCRSKGNISGGARKCWRREPLGGSGGMLPQKNLTSRDLEMLFPAFSKSYL